MINLFAPNTLNELMAKELPPQRWLVDGLIPRGGLTILSARPSAYKTWLMLDSAIAIASGKPLFNHFETEQTGVLVIDEESNESILQERFKNLSADENSPIYYTSRAERLIDEAYSREIISFCQSKDIGIVMFDSLVRLHHKNENDSGEMSIVLNHFKRIADAGISCLILCHNRKSGAGYGSIGESIRGSGDLLASVDVHLALNRKGTSNAVDVIQSKNRYCEELQPFTVTVSKENGKTIFQYNGDVIETRDEKDNQLRDEVLACIADNPGINKSSLERALREGASGKKPSQSRIENSVRTLIELGEVRAVSNSFKNSTCLYANEEE